MGLCSAAAPGLKGRLWGRVAKSAAPRLLVRGDREVLGRLVPGTNRDQILLSNLQAQCLAVFKTASPPQPVHSEQHLPVPSPSWAIHGAAAGAQAATPELPPREGMTGALNSVGRRSPSPWCWER